MRRRRGLTGAAILALPGLLTVWLGFSSGGFFAGEPALAAAIVGAVLLVRLTSASRPLEGVSRPLAVAAGAMGLLAVWTLVSSAWSDAPGRALVEFDRALLYALLVVLFGTLPRAGWSFRWATRGVAAAFVVLSGAGLASRALPRVFPVDASFDVDRLSYPTTYWNATGLCASLALILCFTLTTDAREPAWSRVAAAAAVPVASAALLLTFSRGALGVTALALVAYLVAVRPRAALTGVAAALPTGALALWAAYQASALAGSDPTSSHAVAQGRNLAIVVALCVAAAAVIRLRLVRRDAAEGSGPRLSPRARRRVQAGAAFAVVVACAVAVVAGAPGEIDRQYDRFVHGNDVSGNGDVRSRLTDVGNNGRLEQWRVAVDAWERHPVAGTGAGTYQLEWARDRPNTDAVVDAHSLVLETLSDLGLVGFALLTAGIAAMFVALGRAAKGRNRAVYGGVLVAGGAWLADSAIDWHWEMPAVTLWLFALGGMALARPAVAPRVGGAGRTLRLSVGAALLVVLVTPLQMALSQSRLDDATAALRRGDCRTAIDRSLAAAEALDSRAEPYELLAYCDARLGAHDLAQRAAANAIERDPDNWEYHYDLAIVRAAAGADPRRAARTALELNPRGEPTRAIARAFDTDDPAKWRRRALEARLLLLGR